MLCTIRYDYKEILCMIELIKIVLAMVTPQQLMNESF